MVFGSHPKPKPSFGHTLLLSGIQFNLLPKKKKRQYTKTLLLIYYYYYGKKEIKRQKCCGNFFHLKIKNQIKNKIKRIREIFGLARLLISWDFWSRNQNFNCRKIHEQGSCQNPPSLNGGNLLKLQTLIFSDPMFLPLLLSQPKKQTRTNKNLHIYVHTFKEEVIKEFWRFRANFCVNLKIWKSPKSKSILTPKYIYYLLVLYLLGSISGKNRLPCNPEKFLIATSNLNNPLLICTWILKNQVGKINFDGLVFSLQKSISKFFFASSENHFRKWLRIQFVEHDDFSKLIFRNQLQIIRGSAIQVHIQDY